MEENSSLIYIKIDIWMWLQFYYFPHFLSERRHYQQSFICFISTFCTDNGFII